MMIPEAIVTLDSALHGRMELLVTEMIPGQTFSIVGLNEFKFINVTYHMYNGRMHGKGRDNFEDEIAAAVGAFQAFQEEKAQLN